MMNSKDMHEKYWIWIILLWVVGLVAGIIGFTRYADWHDTSYGFLDNLYLTVRLVSMGSGSVQPPLPLELEFARLFIPLLAAATAINAFWIVFRERIFISGIKRLSGHIIICGLSQKGFLLAQSFIKLRKRVVVIERNKDNSWLEACRASGMYVLLGDATEPVLLVRAGVRHANALFAVCDDDGTNAAIILHAEAQLNQHSDDMLNCIAHISDPRLCSLLREQSVTLRKGSFQLVLFNVFERGAIRMAQEYPAWKNPPLSPPHIIILGLGRFGQNLLVHLARTWWNIRPDKHWKIHATLIDQNALQIVDTLFVRFPQLRETLNVIPINLNVHSAEFERSEYLPSQLLSCIYVCLDNDSLVLEAALHLQQATAGQVPVILRMAESDGLARLLDQPEAKDLTSNLHPFILLEHICTPQLMKIMPRDILAQAMHNEYLQLQKNYAELPPNATVMQTWENLNPVLRKQNYNLVDHQIKLLADYGYTIHPLTDWDAPSYVIPAELVEQMAIKEHELWMRERQAEGWKYKAGIKNQAAKTNPNLVPWKILEENEKEKNRAYFRNIPAFYAQAGFQLCKEK